MHSVKDEAAYLAVCIAQNEYISLKMALECPLHLNIITDNVQLQGSNVQLQGSNVQLYMLS
jgi:hypothetical protein